MCVAVRGSKAGGPQAGSWGKGRGEEEGAGDMRSAPEMQEKPPQAQHQDGMQHVRSGTWPPGGRP